MIWNITTVKVTSALFKHQICSLLYFILFLEFTNNDTYNEHLRRSILVSNAYLNHPVFAYALDDFDITPNRVQELVPRVVLTYISHTGEFWARASHDLGESNLTIEISDYFPRRIQTILTPLPGDQDQEEPINPHALIEYRNLIFFQAASILHELGHLLNRWAYIDKSLDQNLEAGYYLEEKFFHKELYLAYIPNDDVALMKMLGKIA